jgi:hypothetical protein
LNDEYDECRGREVSMDYGHKDKTISDEIGADLDVNGYSLLFLSIIIGEVPFKIVNN